MKVRGGRGGEGSLCTVRYLYLAGESSTRGNARNDGGGVLFFFSFSPAQQAKPQQRYGKLGWIR